MDVETGVLIPRLEEVALAASEPEERHHHLMMLNGAALNATSQLPTMERKLHFRISEKV